MDDERKTGRLIGIARRAGRRAPMEELTGGSITREAGLVGDSRGAKFKSRQITVLAREDWEAALLDLSDLMGPPDLPWTVRRANLLVEGLRLPRAKGGVLQIGPVVLEITGQTNPCHRMDEAHRGLLSALHPEWRGGVTCRVVEGGEVRLGDAARVLVAPKEHVIRLPE
jgi:MOSC domain-containing protein YiiM